MLRNTQRQICMQGRCYLMRKGQASDITEYTPIARALSTMNSHAEETLKRKFDVAYMLAKEGIAFNKIMPVCELMEHHKVDLGTGYKNTMACSTFVDYIARDMRATLSKAIQKSRFFSIEIDGTTDVANVEKELFLVLYFDSYSSDGSVHLRSPFLCVRQPNSVSTEGLYECFRKALSYMEVDVPHKLIGFGCDGTNVNISERGLKGLL